MLGRGGGWGTRVGPFSAKVAPAQKQPHSHSPVPFRAARRCLPAVKKPGEPRVTYLGAWLVPIRQPKATTAPFASASYLGPAKATAQLAIRLRTHDRHRARTTAERRHGAPTTTAHQNTQQRRQQQRRGNAEGEKQRAEEHGRQKTQRQDGSTLACSS